MAALLSKYFVKLVFITLVLLAYIAMHSGLQDFAYGISISRWVFALPGSAALIIAPAYSKLSICKSRMVNPVKSLRSE